MDEKKRNPWYVYVLGVMIFLTATFGDWLSAHNLVIPAVIAVFAFGFGILLANGLRQWKKSDEEILSSFTFGNFAQQKSEASTKRTLLPILSGLVVFFFIFSGSTMPKPVKIIFSIVVIVVTSVNVLLPLRKKRSDTNARNRKILVTSREIAAFFVGLIPCLFFCVFIGIGTYHGVWWFVLPPGLIFLVTFSRPLVAAVRTVYKRCRHDDEVHLRKGKEIDPWDRPDTDPAKYHRK